MSGLLDALVIAAVVALVIVRQFRAYRMDADRRWWLLPVILAVTALREPDLLDARHPTTSGLLLGAELIVGLATGAAWARTTRVWVEADGSVWSKSTRASAAVWFAGVALRLGLFGLGVLWGVHQHNSALILGLAATLLVRSGLLALRVQALRGPAPAQVPAYGDHVPRSAWKERV
ncbi:DUF1453 domain-containing protein [Streptomyces sp. NPDC001027]|uniref:DUF1453 domain-containing protein n=1 Tax=Streptomyces sp. NPDC001027 TaxID=3154771 RepID=UPI0033212C04